MTNARNEHIERCKAKFAEFQANHKFIMRHVHKKTNLYHVEGGHFYPVKGEPVGTVIAWFDGEGIRIGFSKVHKSDKYNRHIGIMRAIEDAMKTDDDEKNVPRQLHDAWDKIVEFAESEKGLKILGATPNA